MSRRDRMRARVTAMPTARVPLAADPAAYAVAEEALAVAEATLQSAAARDDVAALEGLQQAVADLNGALSALPVEVFELQTMSPTDWEQLVAAHQPTDEQRKAGYQWNTATFRPAVLAACVLAADDDDHPLDERGWYEIADEGQMTAGELDLLFITAINLNARQPQVRVGKG